MTIAQPIPQEPRHQEQFQIARPLQLDNISNPEQEENRFFFDEKDAGLILTPRGESATLLLGDQPTEDSLINEKLDFLSQCHDS